MKINELAKLTGTTIRTLHYYDQIGLLKPYRTDESGYRCYSQKNLETLQQILFFKEMDFPLEEIKKIITNPVFDKAEAFSKHQELLLKKRERLDRLIKLLDKTMKGGTEMSFKEFDKSEIEALKKEYAKEVRERWGDSPAYGQSKQKTAGYGKEDWQQINKEMADIFKAFSDNRDKEPDSKEGQDLVKSWQDFISSRFYDCTVEILSGLGTMYINDARFKENIDKNGEGTAAFISKAIAIYCKS